MLTFLHLQTHGDRLQMGHPLCQLVGFDTQIQRDGQTGKRALQRGLVEERQLVLSACTFIYIGYDGMADLVFHFLDIQRGGDILTAPPYLLALIATATDATAHRVIVGVVDHDLSAIEQLELLHALLLQRTEILLMGSTQIGQHTNGRLDDVTQRVHLTRLADTRFEQRHLCLFVKEPYAQGHTNLRVVALGRASHRQLGRQQLVEPLLHHRLTV